MTDSKKPSVTIPLDPILEAYCRYVFGTPAEQKEIAVSRNHDIGRLIHANITVSEFPVRRAFDRHAVTFILPVNKTNWHGITSHFLAVSAWGIQKIRDGIDYEYRKWVERSFELGYEKKYSQKEIIEAVLRGLNTRNTAANFESIKKIDYRRRTKKENRRFFEILKSENQQLKK